MMNDRRLSHINQFVNEIRKPLPTFPKLTPLDYIDDRVGVKEKLSSKMTSRIPINRSGDKEMNERARGEQSAL